MPQAPRISLRLILTLVTILSSGALNSVLAQTNPSTIEVKIEERRATIESLKVRLNAQPSTAELITARQQLRAIRTAAIATITPLREHSSELQADIDRLGTPPIEGASEAIEITRERETLTKELVAEDAIIRQSQLNIDEINRLLDDIALLRREEFYQRLFARSTFALEPITLNAALISFQSGADAAIRQAKGWHAANTKAGTAGINYLLLGASFFLSLLVFIPFRRWVNKSFLHRLQCQSPTPGRRVSFVILRIISRALPGVFAGFAILSIMGMIGLITDLTWPIARQVWFGFIAILVADAGTTAVVSPALPGWRLVPLQAKSGYTLRGGFSFLVFLIFLDRTLTAGANAFGGTQELAQVQSTIIASLIALTLLFLSRAAHWHLTEERKESFSQQAKSFWKNVRHAISIIAIITFVALIFGYLAFGHFIATRTVMLGGLVALGLTLHLIAKDALQLFDKSGAEKTLSMNTIETDTAGENFLLFWLIVLADIVIIALLLPITLIIIGASWSDVLDFIKDAFLGFSIGGVNISLAKILTALGTFLLIILLSRSIQKTAQTQFFPRTNIDIGLQNSMKTLIGYVGLLIAFMTAISMLGFNLSNLAIIAGALSVGIGFGLQSIVNNFVSGLILLFERPIKVGDWIVVASGEGFVKSISVRSTEIETFDKSSIIVPNSELISGTVQNWTHKDKMGRFIVSVGVSYDSDPDQIEMLLHDVARENPLILSYPAPFVNFVDFSDSALTFELRAFIRDITTSLSVRTQVRKSIFKKFREHGIEIPFPQRDLHIKASDNISLGLSAHDKKG